MTGDIHLAYGTPTSVRTHLRLVAAGGLPVTVRGHGRAQRAQLRASIASGSDAGLTIHGLPETVTQTAPVQLRYEHAGVKYQFMTELHPGGPGQPPTIRLPRQVLRSDSRLSRRVPCRHLPGFSATIGWGGRTTAGTISDLSANGMRLTGLTDAPPADVWVALQPRLGEVQGAVVQAQVRHRQETAEGVQIGLLIPGRGLCEDPQLQGILRQVLQVPLGPVRIRH